MSPWRNWLARSAVNRKVGGSSPPGDDTFGLAGRKLFHYLNFIISVILLVLHCNKIMENHLSSHNCLFFVLLGCVAECYSNLLILTQNPFKSLFLLVASEFSGRQ